jgi:hypothetical protein
MSVIDAVCHLDSVRIPFHVKGVRIGTGLGLANVYEIIVQSSGEIFLTREVGKGTAVEIVLPALDKASLDCQRHGRLPDPGDRKPDCWWKTKMVSAS